MTKEDFRNMEPGTKLLVGTEFYEGEDPDVTPWFGKIITFKSFGNDRWVYFEECPGNPFHYMEIVGLAEVPCIDEDVEYQHGDIELIFGEVTS